MRESLRSILGIVWPHLRPRWPVLVPIVVLGFLASLGPTALVALLAPLWDLVLFPGQGVAGGGSSNLLNDAFAALRDRFADPGAEALSEEARLTALWVVSGVAVVLVLLSAAATYAFTCLARWLSLRLVVDLRMQLARHLMGLSMRYHQERRFGDLLSRISADVGTMLQAVQIVFRDFVMQPAMILVTLGSAVLIAPQLSLVMLVAAPALAWPIARLAKKIRRKSTKSLTSLGASVQSLTQMFGGVRTVKAYRAEERELEGFGQANEQYLKHSMSMVRTIALTHAWTMLFSNGGLAVMLVPIGWLAITQGVSDGGAMFTFFMLMSKSYVSVKKLTKSYTQLQESVGASDRLRELLDEHVDVVELENPVRITSLGGGVEFEGVTFAYRDEDEPALRDVDLVVEPGETLAVVGPSGAGKSTLADLLCRFIDPTDGRVLVDGHDLREVAKDDWSSLCAHVDQVPFLFHASIGENIRYGRPGATREDVEAAARAANIHEFIEGLPDGYETDVADAGMRLSGGQRQRIVIARAILRDAPLLILDEATSALDSESEKQVQQALDALMKDRTVVVIAHRLSTIRNADRIAVLDRGRLVELGPHDDLVTRAGTYARLHELQHAST